MLRWVLDCNNPAVMRPKSPHLVQEALLVIDVAAKGATTLRQQMLLTASLLSAKIACALNASATERDYVEVLRCIKCLDFGFTRSRHSCVPSPTYHKQLAVRSQMYTRILQLWAVGVQRK